MPLIWTVLCLAAISVWAYWQRKQVLARKEIAQYSITPEELRQSLAAGQVLLYDVRQPLDLLASSEMIPGSTRIPPKQVLANPFLIPIDRDTVVYCTCPSDKTSLAVIDKARRVNFTRVKFLKGGLEAWKAAGFEVEPYTESFRLDTGT